jgi:hypothetical protein
MKELEKFLDEELQRIEEEIDRFGNTMLITFSADQDLRPLAMNIARRYESTWSEYMPFSIREGIEVVNGDFYITILGEANGRQFVVSKKLETEI